MFDAPFRTIFVLVKINKPNQSHFSTSFVHIFAPENGHHHLPLFHCTAAAVSALPTAIYRNKYFSILSLPKTKHQRKLKNGA
jgi:hypothetical protein